MPSAKNSCLRLIDILGLDKMNANSSSSSQSLGVTPVSKRKTIYSQHNPNLCDKKQTAESFEMFHKTICLDAYNEDNIDEF